MRTQEAYLECSKHCATFPLWQTIHTAVVAQVLPLVLVVKITVTELSSVPPHPLVSSKTPELCHMTSQTIPHLTSSETSCVILVSDNVVMSVIWWQYLVQLR